MKVSAYVPCLNNGATLEMAIASILNQTLHVTDFFVVDDGSTDGSYAIAEKRGVRVVRFPQNLGRGAVRARAMLEAANEFVVSCDATNVLASDFVERGLRWFEGEDVAAVFGRICQEDRSTATTRWRARHLFKMDCLHEVRHVASLATGGVILRKAAVLAAGNFNATLRHSEDADLGRRLLARGYDVIFDPALHVKPLTTNTLPEVLERYWRWYAGTEERASWKGYFKQVGYSIKVMAKQDLQSGDPLSALVSLYSPHYQFWRSRWRRGLFRSD